MHPLARGLEAVIFDVGNTLFYLDYPRLLATLSGAGLEVAAFSPEDAALAERRARPSLSAWLLANAASTEDPASFARYVALALENLGIRPGSAALDRAFRALCAEHRRANFFGVPAPRALEAVSALARRYKLAVVSNAGGKVAAKLAEAGFAPLLAGVVDSGLLGIEKPDRRIFLEGCAHAAVAPERALYVGDLHSIDVLGARGAGLRAVLLDPAGAYAASGLAGVDLFADIPSLSRVLLDGSAG
jgi:putative hydrolase of the HAD superfamily